MRAIYRVIFSLCFPFLYWKNRLFQKQGGLRVLIYHDLNTLDILAFEKQIKWLSSHYSFISPAEFKEIIDKKLTLSGNKILITFDDGFYSGYTAAVNVLKKYGVKGIFFIISDFVQIEDRNIAHQFISKNIIPGKPITQILKDSFNLSSNNLKQLISDGHTIGGHTRTHARLSTIKEMRMLEEEIISSADSLEKILGIEISDFAYTFGDIDSFSSDALYITKKRFKYIYTGLRGNNADHHEPLCVCREAVSPHDSNWLLGTFLEGGADFLYKSQLKHYKNWMQSS